MLSGVSSSIRQSPLRQQQFLKQTAQCARRSYRQLSVKAQSGWLQEDQRRFLHAVYRIGNLEKTRDFYTKSLGMKVLRERDVPDGKFFNLFLGYGPEDKNFALELTYNYGTESYDIGEGFGHFGLATTDIYKVAETVKANGGKVPREPGPVKGGTTNIAFVEDPTGYKWELLDRPQGTQEPLAQIMLRVGNLEKSIEYYTKALGMKLLKERDNPDYKYKLAFLGYGDELNSTVLELTYNYGKDQPYEKGNGYAQLALSTNDVYKSAEAVKAAGFQVTKDPGPVLDGTKIFATQDPDGYKFVFVDNQDFLSEL